MHDSIGGHEHQVASPTIDHRGAERMDQSMGATQIDPHHLFEVLGSVANAEPGRICAAFETRISTGPKASLA